MLEEKYPSQLLENAVEAFATLPGIGRRGALRLALHLLNQPKEKVLVFSESIKKLKEEAKYCKCCMMISDSELCAICSDSKRDKKTICVVENVRDVLSIENTGQYKGLYHVLGSVISPIRGIGPSDLNVEQLLERVEKLCAADSDSPKIEIIFALSGSVEGEMTSFYIYRKLSSFDVKVTSLARGIGFGDDLEYTDELTLGRAIANRQVFGVNIESL